MRCGPGRPARHPAAEVPGPRMAAVPSGPECRRWRRVGSHWLALPRRPKVRQNGSVERPPAAPGRTGPAAPVGQRGSGGRVSHRGGHGDGGRHRDSGGSHCRPREAAPVRHGRDRLAGGRLPAAHGCRRRPRHGGHPHVRNRLVAGDGDAHRLARSERRERLRHIVGTLQPRAVDGPHVVAGSDACCGRGAAGRDLGHDPPAGCSRLGHDDAQPAVARDGGRRCDRGRCGSRGLVLGKNDRLADRDFAGHERRGFGVIGRLERSSARDDPEQGKVCGPREATNGGRRWSVVHHAFPRAAMD